MSHRRRQHHSFRPFPLDELRDALPRRRSRLSGEKPGRGLGGMLAANVRMALRGIGLPVYTVIAGLGGRPITRASLTGMFDPGGQRRLET